jgi:hypothetical protein
MRSIAKRNVNRVQIVAVNNKLFIILISSRLWLLEAKWLICPERVTQGVYDVTRDSQVSPTQKWWRIRNKMYNHYQNALHEFCVSGMVTE